MTAVTCSCEQALQNYAEKSRDKQASAEEGMGPQCQGAQKELFAKAR